MKALPPLEPIARSTIERLKHNYILQAWLVLSLAVFFGASLAGVHLRLGPRIEANKTNESRQRIPEIILGSAQAGESTAQGRSLLVKPHTFSVESGTRKISYSAYEVRHPDGELAGWVVKASGQGYADRIELLIGFAPLGDTITGIFVLDQKETPGLGNKIIGIEWREQFAAMKTTQPIMVTKSGAKRANEVDAITGATISSRSVAQIVNTTINDLRRPLAQMAAAAQGS
jgi:Na+-translocating ferredoxin:NAD+ oxidoreductase subunit G